MVLKAEKEVSLFFSHYDKLVHSNALKLREMLISNLPGIIEQIDISAKMVAYCYGQIYSELICVIIPSKKGLKLGFNRGTELPDPDNLLEGKGKISRYVQISTSEQIQSLQMERLIQSALALYKQNQQQK